MLTTRGFSLIRWFLRSTDFLVALTSWVAIWFPKSHGVNCSTNDTQLTEVFSGDVLEFGTEVGEQGIRIGKCVNNDKGVQ